MSNRMQTNSLLQTKEEILQKQNQLRLNHEEIKNQNRPLTNKEIELVIKNAKSLDKAKLQT